MEQTVLVQKKKPLAFLAGTALACIKTAMGNLIGLRYLDAGSHQPGFPWSKHDSLHFFEPTL